MAIEPDTVDDGRPNRGEGLAGRVLRGLKTPILAPIISRPIVLGGIVCVCGLQLGLTAAHLPAMQCPVPKLLHVPCPGCGLTRAGVAVVEGRWLDACHTHIFAFVAVLAGVLLVCAVPMSARVRGRYAAAVEAVERRTACSGLLLALLFVYWLGRLLYDGGGSAL